MNEIQTIFFRNFNDELGHIGNIKIGNINQLHRFGDIGLLIGTISQGRA